MREPAIENAIEGFKSWFHNSHLPTATARVRRSGSTTAKAPLSGYAESSANRSASRTSKERCADLAAALTVARDRLIIPGYHHDGERWINTMRLLNRSGIAAVNAHGRDPRSDLDGMGAAARAVAVKDGGLDPSFLLTHGFQLERMADAFLGWKNVQTVFSRA